MLSATADYALRAVLLLAREGGGPLKADAIAKAIGAPANYLAKTLNTLARAGIVTSTRGPLGGFSLAVASDRLTLDRIISVFDEPQRTPKCLLRDAPCNAVSPCAAHVRWQSITRPTREALVATSVAQLLETSAV